MKLRLLSCSVLALLVCLQQSVRAVPYELSVKNTLETTSIGGVDYQTIQPSTSNSWNLSKFDLHIGREQRTIFSINSGASLTVAGVNLYGESTLNLFANSTLRTGSFSPSARDNYISGTMTIATAAKWYAQGKTVFVKDEVTKLVLGEFTGSIGSDNASIIIGAYSGDVSTLTTQTVEGKGAVYIESKGVWQAYGNTTLNYVKNVGSLVIGDGTNTTVFQSAMSGGQKGTVHISKNATWESNGTNSLIDVGKVTVEGVWDMSVNPSGRKDQKFQTQGVELVGGSTVRMNLVDAIQTQGDYNLTFSGSGPYNLELIYSTLSGKNYTLMTFSNEFDASQFTLTKGNHSQFELRSETSGSTTSLVWTYLTDVITYTDSDGDIKKRSAKWTFNDDATSPFKTTNFSVTVNKTGVLSTTKGSVFSAGDITIKDGGKWNISGAEAIVLGGSQLYPNVAMSVLVKDGGVLSSSAVLKVNGLKGSPVASLTITGATSSWTATNDVYLASVDGGAGVVNIADGAQWNTSKLVWLSQDKNGTGAMDASSTINLNRATWTSKGAVTGVGNSAINISSGSTWKASLDTSIGSLVNNGTWYAGGDSQITSSLTNTGNLYIGGEGSTGVMRAKTAIFAGGTLFYDYTVGAQDQLHITESLNFSGPMTIDLGINGWLGADDENATSYTLISYQAGVHSIDPSSIILKGLWLGSSRQTYSLDFSHEGEICLLVTGQAARLTWNGGDNAVWDLNSSEWMPDPATADNHFRNTDYVVFDGTKTLAVEGSVWTSILSVTEASNITMNTESGQIISTLTQNAGSLKIKGGLNHHLGSVENIATAVLTLDGLQGSEIESIKGGTLTLSGGSDVSITGEGSKLTTLSGDGVLMVNKSFSVENANAATIKLAGDASVNIEKLSGSTLELQEHNIATIDQINGGKLIMEGGQAQIKSIAKGEIMMSAGYLSANSFSGDVTLNLKGGRLDMVNFLSSNSQFFVSGGEACVSSYMQGFVGGTTNIQVSGGKLTSLGLVQVASTTLSGGELIVGAFVGSNDTIFKYEGGALKFNLSLNLGLREELSPIGPKPKVYSFLHDMSAENSITGALSGGLKTGDVFGADLVVNAGGGTDLLGKTFSISNQPNVDFGAIRIEGSLLQKTELGKSGIWSFGGFNFGYTFNGNELVFDSYTSEITKPPVVTPNPDDDGYTVVYEEVILKTGDSSVSKNNLTVSLAPPGDIPGEDGGEVTEIQLGTGLEDAVHTGLKGTSLATYVVTKTLDSEGSLIKTEYSKPQNIACGLFVSGEEVLKPASDQELAVIGKVTEDSTNMAIAAINSSAGTSLTLENTQINLTNDDGDFTSRVESTTVTLNGDSLLSGVSAQNTIQMHHSTVQGSGTLENVDFIGGALHAGDVPSMMELKNITTKVSNEGLHVTFQAKICNFGHNVVLDGMNDNVDSATGNVSQFNITGNVVLGAGTVFEIVLWNAEDVGSFDLKTLEQGAKFQFFTFNGGSIAGEFTGILNAPALADGLMWDISQLTTAGFAQVIGSSMADGSRIANTLWTSGQTVANISTEAVKHVGEAVTGKTTVWLSSLNDFIRANSEGMSTGYDFNTQGYSVGAQRGIEGGHVIGLAFGNSYGTHTPLQDSTHASAGKIKQNAVMGSVYGRIMLSNMAATDNIWSIDAYAGYGEVSNKSTRMVKFDSSTANAKWNDMVRTVGIQGNFATKLNDKTIVTPFAALDFIHGEQDDFTEQAKSVKANYDNGTYYNLRASLGASISHVIAFSNGMALIPSLTASYGYDVCRMNPHTDVSEAAGGYRAYGVNPGRNSFQITPALSWKINKAWSASTNYTLRTRSGLTDQSVNASVGYTF